MLKRLSLAISSIVLVITAGCASVEIHDTIYPNGACLTKLEFETPKMAPPMLSPSPFILPTGKGWTIVKSNKNGQECTTATRLIQPGETLSDDIHLQSTDPKTNQTTSYLVNSVKVERLSQNRLKYVETLHWVGKKDHDFMAMDQKSLTQLKALLPSSLATDANVRKLSSAIITQIWKALFGPGEPLLPVLIMQPQLAEHRLDQRIGQSILTSLKKTFGDKLTEGQRIKLVREIFQVAKQTRDFSANQMQSPSPSNSSQANLCALYYSVKMPGKVLDSNGEMDNITGEVFWGVYDEAAMPGDVTLYAICKTGK
jgi:hypothetical protein